MLIVRLTDIKKTYPLGKVLVHALNGIDLTIERGDFVAIAGHSGAGKTTLMNLIGLLDKPTEGSIEIDGRNVKGLSDNELSQLRHEHLGFVFQSFNLIQILKVYENVELPLLLGKQIQPKSERREWVNSLLEEVGLADWRNHRPSELSGGQRQRVSIARALAGRPEIVLADEPTANLDSKTGETILNLMKKINKEQNTTFIFSTHDPAIRKLSNHVVLMKDGIIISEERKREAF